MGRRDDQRAAKWAARQRRTQRGRGRDDQWESRLRALGLGVVNRRADTFSARGRRKATTLAVFGRQGPEGWTWTLQASNKYLAPDLRVLPERGRTWLQNVVQGSEQDLGDPVLDDLAYIQGPPDQLLAALTETTRGRLRDLVARGGRVEDRTVQLVVRDTQPRPGWLPDRARELQELAIRLAVHPKRRVAALARSAQRDPLPAVQLAALRVLLTEHPEKTPTALLTQARLLPLLSELPLPGLTVALEALGRVGTSEALSPIAPYAVFPRGNNATRKAARAAARAIAERTAPEGGLAVASEAARPEGSLTVAGEVGGLAESDDQ